MKLRSYPAAIAIWFGLIALAYGLLLASNGNAGVIAGIAAIFSLPFLIARCADDQVSQGRWWLALLIGMGVSCVTFFGMIIYPISRI